MIILELYNNFALYSWNLCQNEKYFIAMVIVCGFISFLGSIIYHSYFDKYISESFAATFFISLLIGFIGIMVGAFLAIAWSMLLCYVLPLVLFCYLIFRGKDILKYFSNIKINKTKDKILKTVSEEIKYEELAKQVYENLKKDFPGIKFSDILEKVKSQRT